MARSKGIRSRMNARKDLANDLVAEIAYHQ